MLYVPCTFYINVCYFYFLIYSLDVPLCMIFNNKKKKKNKKNSSRTNTSLSKIKYSIWISKECPNKTVKLYYGRIKYPDPPIINTDNTHMSHRNFQRSSTLDWYCLRCMHGLAYRMA